VAYYLTQNKGPGEKKSAYEREYEAFDSLKDGRPRYVLSLDKIDSSHGGITHVNIEDFLLRKTDFFVS
jgi:predicted AAA+ superfamily ATPase